AGFTHEPAITLSENLLGILPQSFAKIFYSDNGSTAVEVALKMAMQYWHNQGIARKKIVAIEGSYHGDTFGAMAVGDRSIFTAPFSPYLFDVEFIPFPFANDEVSVIQKFRNIAESGDVAAFIYEPLIQAAGGMRMYSPGTLNQLLLLAKEKGIICIADEVFTGFGRTGKLLASDHVETKPDLVALSKGLTGGTLPLGVTAVSEKILVAFQTKEFTKTFFHGHSFTANPLSCAAANASFTLLQRPDCQQRINSISDQHQKFAAKVRNNSVVKEVRTLGTILAIELESTEKTSYSNSIRQRIYQYFLDRDILLRPLGNTFYIVAPYCTTNEQLSDIYAAIDDFLSELTV
ncbi:MAG TPA: adenosylmethionine--8-amino-7-oxononanoate transaminase, partial [Cyclobacteriaceae bacterium]|nr:adenosylmethionine--8-amino-7-oxononanoate transaminase [Cyclobacteriaceae bacterium]